MASYHFTIKVGKTGKAAPHAKYICREGKYKSKKDHDLEYKKHVNMPKWAEKNPNDFWKADDQYERINGATYRELELALPVELTPEERIELVNDFVEEHLGNEFVYSYAIHCPKAALNPEIDQPHVHIMFSERRLDGIYREKEKFFSRANSTSPELGGAKKDERWRGMNKNGHLTKLRESWARYQNLHLERKGHSIRVDHRTLEEQGIDRKAEKHLGPKTTNRAKNAAHKYASKAISFDEKIAKLEEYFSKIEPSDKVKYMISLRGLKALQKEIHDIEQRDVAIQTQKKQWVYVKDIVSNIGTRLEEIKSRIQVLSEEQKTLRRSTMTPKRAESIAIGIYTKKLSTEVENERDNLRKVREKLILDMQLYSKTTRPSLINITARNEHDTIGKSLAIASKNLSAKEKELAKKEESLSQIIASGRGKIDSIKEGVLKKYEKDNAQFEKNNIEIVSLQTERKELISLRSILKSRTEIQLPPNAKVPDLKTTPGPTFTQNLTKIARGLEEKERQKSNINIRLSSDKSRESTDLEI